MFIKWVDREEYKIIMFSHLYLCTKYWIFGSKWYLCVKHKINANNKINETMGLTHANKIWHKLC